MTVPKKYSGRLIVTYLDEPMDGIIKDMYGKQYEFHELSGIHMEPSDYNLTMSDIYLSLLLENVEGEL